ncbi:MAG: alpha/beta fold hydrolase [Clostridia bacterium]|nr:alpha/beta fold hydrolase [Clostridia bacterium]MBR3974618.1 alpha/beta fold hydrolase [Clostridia bacterium]
MAIEKREAYFTSSNGINKVRTLIWEEKDKKAVGIVQIAHGLSEHIGRYDEFARFLAAKGFIVCGNDHLGHGKTAVGFSPLGYVERGDHVNMVRDMNTLHNIMVKRYPELPYFIFGHSMGSLLARIYCSAFGDTLSGAVFCATLQLPEAMLLFENPVEKILSLLPEEDTSVNILNELFGKATKWYYKGISDYSWLSENEENIAAFISDPLCGAPVSSALARELVTMAVKVSSHDWAQKIPSDLPVLLISGAKDAVGFFGRGVVAVEDALKAAGVETEMYLYPASRHEILNEDSREKVFEDVYDFLEDIIDD